MLYGCGNRLGEISRGSCQLYPVDPAIAFRGGGAGVTILRALRQDTPPESSATRKRSPLTRRLRVFAAIVAEARGSGRRPSVMDTWIAGTGVRHGLIVFTRDADFDDIPQVQVRRI